jgi:hypothetical protein
MATNSTETRTRLRRMLVRSFPARMPGTRTGRFVLLVLVRRVYRLSDWVAHNAETAMIELEDAM